MEFNQIYKAPSIPKLSRRTISSPFGEKSALATPKLKKTSFSFIRGIKSVPSAILQKPEGEKEEDKQGLAKVLSDTNKIFGEIRDQLALDFATRIADAKKSLSKIKQDNYKKRRGLKEGLISGAKSIGSGILGQVNQILAPTKSIFQKIIEFFQIILTGIILNNAFKWLQKKENREKVAKVFKFVADHWKELLILFGTYKLVRLLFKIIGAVKKIKSLIDFLRKKPPGPGGGTPNICNQILNCFGNPATVTSLAQNLLKNAIFLGGVKGLVAAKPQPKPKPITSPPLTPAPIPTGPVTSPIGQKPEPKKPWWQDPGKLALAIAGILAAGAAGFALEPAAGKPLKQSNNRFNFNPTFRTATGVAGAAEGGTIEKPKKKKCTACAMGFEGGGSVGGRGKPKADDQPAWVSTGEYITRTAMANLWRPLLIDINEAGGKLFEQFRQGVIKLNDLVGKLISNSKVFRDITEEFNNYLKQEVQKKKLKDASGGGTGRIVSMKPPATKPASQDNQDQKLIGKSGIIGENLPTTSTQSISKVDFSSNVNQKINLSVITNKVASRITPTTTGSSKPVIVPMTLPPITGKMPEVPTPTATSSEVPNISSVNMANPYMQNAKAYGIFVV